MSRHVSDPLEGACSEMDCSSACDVRVTGGRRSGRGAWRVCSFWRRFADGLGLGEALSAVVAPGGERAPVHDRGKVLVHALLMLAGGGEACSRHRASAGPAGAVRAGGVGPRRCIARCGAWAPRWCSRFWLLWRSVRVAVWERRGDTTGSEWGGSGHRLDSWWRCTLRTRLARRRISRRGSGPSMLTAPRLEPESTGTVTWGPLAQPTRLKKLPPGHGRVAVRRQRSPSGHGDATSLL